ncbi:hypothetical protein [Magnetococcus sp. PR-3]|uniref:hypothetical protein n=1 Tax=Magnetococcus sp. PR-3 TaxID=3120355 RepID=UPI002FCDE8B5
MKQKTVDMMASVANSPMLNLVIGLFLLACGLAETIHELEQEFTHPKAHHGMFVFGLIQAFKSLSMVLKGMK